MALPEMRLRDPDGNVIGDAVPYYSLAADVGGISLTLALHRDQSGAWVLSDPESGAKIGRVHGDYKGATVSSQGMSVKEARYHAGRLVERISDGVGSQKFLAVVETARRKVKERA